MENLYGKIKIVIKGKGILKRIYFMGKGYINGEIRKCMKEIGKKVKFMERVN